MSIGLASPGSRRAAVDRRADRVVAVVGVVVALLFLLGAVLVVLLPSADRAGLWLPVHLALAGGATAAIAGVMPFFSAAIAATQPVAARLRWASLIAVALGAALVTLGFTRGMLELASAGGLIFIGGALSVGYATLAPLRRGLGPRGGIVAAGYAAAVAMVVVGATLATLFLAGWDPVLEAWAALKPAHAWLNLVGFVSLIIATTLLHFFPTVIGARIQRVPAAYATIFGLATGTIVVATGFAIGSDLIARLGAVIVELGALALALYAFLVWRTRGQWRTALAWHRFAMGGLVSAIAWFEVGMLLASGAVLLDGASPVAVDVALLAGPLIAGWMGLSVLASATHLVPAVGPGDGQAHGRQRHILGAWASIRLALANLGIVCLTAGLAFEVGSLAVAGMALLGAVMAGTAALLVLAVMVGLRSARSGVA